MYVLHVMFTPKLGPYGPKVLFGASSVANHGLIPVDLDRQEITDIFFTDQSIILPK